MELSESDFTKLQTLEEELWKAETRFNQKHMEKVFSPDLFEFGRSGRIHSREALLSAQGTEINARLPLENLKIRLIEDNVAQVTYNSHVEYSGVVESARRSSIWSFTGGEWVLRFHQGTPFE
jgi:hypothetical protein